MTTKSDTCRGRTKVGTRCTRKASDSGYCYQHGDNAKDGSLTEKQRRFVEAYMGQAAGNATEAARLAGYAGEYQTLASVGNENLKKPEIRAAIELRIDADPLVATRFDRQRFWTRVMSGRELDGEGPAQMKDRLKASELLAKSQGDFVERVEHTGKDGGPIEHAQSPEDRRARIEELMSITKAADDE